MVQLPLKEKDAWWTVLAIDPIAGPLVRLVHRFPWVTPNRLTLFSVVLALCAAGFFAAGHLVLGALLFQASFLVDCMDGKLAGLRGGSPWGRFVDQAGDGVRFFACLLGIVYGTVGDSDVNVGWVLAIAAYPCARFTVLVLGEARPTAHPRGFVSVPARFSELLRTAPGRLTQPGTSVDAEALAFTVGPLVGEPLLGLTLAAAVDAIHAAGLGARGLLAERSQRSVDGASEHERSV